MGVYIPIDIDKILACGYKMQNELLKRYPFLMIWYVAHFLYGSPYTCDGHFCEDLFLFSN